MALHEKMVKGLRVARSIASPYAETKHDPDVNRRELASYFDKLIDEADRNLPSKNVAPRQATRVLVDDRKFLVHFDQDTGSPTSVDAWVDARAGRSGYWRQAWVRTFGEKPGPLVKRALEAVPAQSGE